MSRLLNRLMPACAVTRLPEGELRSGDINQDHAPDYLEEVMTPAASTGQPAFTRVCYLCFNVLNSRWEYVSLDTRIPAQLMYELSADGKLAEGQTLVLDLPGFTLPGWGSDVTGQWARQRREITLEDPDRQIMRQYWTLPATPKEYLAVSYVYSRQE
jgi:hypothetical protein